jgi:1-phosphatidylinositol phosphodiesterase
MSPFGYRVDQAVYHGPRPQRSSLTTLLHTLHAFLTAHPTETFLLSIKEEIPPFHPQFSLKVYQAFQPYLAKFWFVDERIPSLGEVRGKGMILSRFNRCGDGSVEQGGWGEGLGIHPYTWPDSRKEGFEWSCRDVTVRTQDWYIYSLLLCINLLTMVGIASRPFYRYPRSFKR